MKKDQVNLSGIISKELHRKLKVQLAKDDLTFQGWLEDRIREYVGETPQDKRRQAINSLKIDKD